MNSTTAEPGSQEPRSFSAGDVVLYSEAWVWAFNPNEYPVICAFCFTEKHPQQLRTCSGCKLHRYCDAKCQTADWKKEHRNECAILKAISVQIAPSVPDEDFEIPLNQLYGYFDYSAADLLVAKVDNKFKLNVMEEVFGSGKMSPQDIFKSLTIPVPFDDHRTAVLNLTGVGCPPVLKRSSQLIASLLGIPLNTFSDYYSIASHNAFQIRMGPVGDLRLAGFIVYRHPLRRTMVPVCSDVNILMDNRGRNLTMFAAEDIPVYTGFHDLRYKYWPVRDEYCYGRTDRRQMFGSFHGFPCTCRKCTTEYEAEVNPLKCVTVGCMERIPSDQRALPPCEQCGASNADRLEKFQQFMQKYQAGRQINETNVSALSAKDVLLKELDAAGLVHSDAYIRYLCGSALAPLFVTQGRYEEGWKLMQEMTASVRNVYPTFHDGRAALLSSAAACPLVCLRTILEKEQDKKTALTRREKTRLTSIFTKACATSLDYFAEARDIFVKLSGQDSQATKHCDKSISDLQFVLQGGSIDASYLRNHRYQIFYEK